MKGKHSRQFHKTSLRSLLSLDTIPDQIKIPCWHLPHSCAYCSAHRYPPNLWISLFVHISAWPRRRGRPSRNDENTELILYSSSNSSIDSEAFHGLYDSDEDHNAG